MNGCGYPYRKMQASPMVAAPPDGDSRAMKQVLTSGTGLVSSHRIGASAADVGPGTPLARFTDGRP
jgi:hypothetical protein